jgi:hypothetical protein
MRILRGIFWILLLWATVNVFVVAGNKQFNRASRVCLNAGNVLQIFCTAQILLSMYKKPKPPQASSLFIEKMKGNWT